MTNIRKRVEDVLETAVTLKGEHKFLNGATYDMNVIPDWQEFVRSELIFALGKYDKTTQKKCIQETIKFDSVALRDKTVITVFVSWIERNEATGSLHLQSEQCSKIFGNIY